ncbi:PDZ domain-containing protein [Ruminococcus sp. 5_1_39BFAA]|uniref:PDZ domain-containing protein n=1 Tax=Ruminococcus sp. 5_1_39BFAA TaxID=457412 RepID=UPI003567BE75
MKNKKNKIGHLITHVQPRFIAEEQTIEAEDYLLEINGQTIEDVFDYRLSSH